MIAKKQSIIFSLREKNDLRYLQVRICRDEVFQNPAIDNWLLMTLLKLAFIVGRAFQPDKMAARVADPDSFGHREMTALLNWQKFYYDKTGVFLTPDRHSPETRL